MASYFDDFLDMGDTQPIKVDDLPDAFESLAELSGLPSGVVANALTSAVKGQNATPPLPEPIVDPAIAMTSALANLQPGTRLADLTGDEGFAIRSLLARDTPNFDVFTRVGENIDPTTNQLPPFDLDPVRERTPFLDTGPEYTGGVLPPSQLPGSNNRFSAISNVLSNLDFGIGGSGRFLYPTIGMDSFTSDLPGTQTTTRFTPAQTGAPGAVIGPGGVPGFYEDVVSFTAPATAQPFPFISEFAPGEFGLGDPMGIAAENVNIGTGISPEARAALLMQSGRGQPFVAPQSYLGGAMQFGDSIASPTTTQLPIEFIQNPTARGIVTTPDTTTSVAPVDDGTLRTRTRVTPDVDKPKPDDEDSDDAENIIQTGGIAKDDAPTTSFPPRSQSRRGQYFTSGTSVYVYHPFYQDNDGYKYVGETAYTDSDGEQQPSTVNNDTVNADLRRADSNLQEAIANNQMDAQGNKLFSTEQPSAPEAPSQFPIAPSLQELQKVYDSPGPFGQAGVQGIRQPIQEVMRAPTTYGEVLGGTPMQPMTTTGGFYDDLYQQSLSPVEAFKAYQLSQFPGASLGSRLAAQDALGTGFDPAFGRFLLGSASGRIAPTFETVDGSGGFGRYLRDRQRADLSQVRQEFANLGAALRGYTPGGALDPRFASYYETFGDPSDPSGLRGSVLRAAQAALGTRQRTGALGNIYDVMQQQYGAGAGSRFADFVSGAFAQRPMVQPMQSFASPTSNFLAQSQSNPYYGVSATSAMARQQPIVTPEPTLFGGTMGY